jgi:hypothetical protein
MDDQIYASEHELASTALYRVEADDDDDRSATRELLAAVDDLARGWLVPLGIALSIDCCDPSAFDQASATIRPPRPHWFLRVPDLPTGVVEDPAYRNPVIETAPQLDAVTIERWIERAVAQRCPSEGHFAAFGEMTWTMLRARVPQVGEAKVTDGHGLIPSVFDSIDGELWAYGPALGNIRSPAWLRAANYHGDTKIHLRLFWDVHATWPAGRALVDAGVARVLARGRGWQTEFPA